MADERQLIVRGNYDNIPTITSFVAEAAEAAGLSETDVFHCQMAVDEACTNVIEHAYGNEDRGEIQITCSVEPGCCRIEVIDNGEPFVPDKVPEPQLDATLDEIEPGGIGLHLMRQMMDVVKFSFNGEQNILLMEKRGDVSSSSTPGDIPVFEPVPDVIVIHPEGRLDSSVAPDLETTFVDQLNQGNHWLVLDFSSVSYISSRGLKAVVKAWRGSQDQGGKLVLAGLSDNVYSVLETVGFTQIFSIYATRDEAVAGLLVDRTGG